jgi:hypothetical protein
MHWKIRTIGGRQYQHATGDDRRRHRRAGNSVMRHYESRDYDIALICAALVATAMHAIVRGIILRLTRRSAYPSKNLGNAPNW